jgi:ubiquinol-cytochrome c reductase cytochrome b subunit
MNGRQPPSGPPPRPPTKPEPKRAETRRPEVRIRPGLRTRLSLGAWLDHRTGYSAFIDGLLERPVTGGARLWYVFGSVAAFLVMLEIATGILLAAYYAPSVTDAWASVAFIQDTLTAGWFVRGLHSFGSSALIVVSALHLLQVLIFGAYKAPREVNWMVGLAMLGLVLLFALSGYLLPWDQKGYWAKLVEVTILANTPLVGGALAQLVQGGSAFGNYTLTHAFAVHTGVLPAVLIALLVLHVHLARRHGVTPPFTIHEADLEKKTQPFWPRQAFRNALASALTMLIVVSYVLGRHGAELDAPADPGSSYVARPEWYALPLFQLRMYFEGTLEIVATMIIPGILTGVLFALPFLDRAPSRDPRRRPAVMGGALAVLAGMLALSAVALRRDSHDPLFTRARAEGRERAETARRLARLGVPPEGGDAVFRNDPYFQAREIWDEKCAGCHSLGGRGGEKGPDLRGYNSRAWIRGFLENPAGPLYMGPAKLQKGMKPVEGTADELAALTELVYAQTGAEDVDAGLAERGRALVPQKDCDSCHEFDGESESTGPNLAGRGRLEYVIDVLGDAGQPRLYGQRNKMPRFANKLSPDEIALVARFVLSQR